MKKLLLSLVVLALIGSANAELVTNGSFEYWPEEFGLQIYGTAGDWIGGATGEWEVIEPGGGIVALPDGWNASPVSDGYWNMHIADGGSIGSIAQTIATEIGQEYTLSFWHEDFSNDQLAVMNVKIAGLDQDFATIDPIYQTATFTATATSSVLIFENVEYGNTIDEVSVVPVPEPITIALLGLGGLLIRKKR